MRVSTSSPALLLAAGAALYFASCNCGPGVGSPCKNAGDCGKGLYCKEGRCALSSGGNGDGGSGDGGPCAGLECSQVECPAGQTTRITGKVYAPNGTLPLYNAVVYVPNAPVGAFAPGVICDKCGGTLSGSPVVQAATGYDGTFQLDNVPAGPSIPLVIQVGRWRRQVTVNVPGCTTTALTDANFTRLPRTQSEGDIPLMALATGSADPFECLLRKIGLADSEFTLPSGSGRVHYYRQNGKNMSPPAPGGSTLYSDLNVLKKYDVVMLPCEGGEYAKPQPATQNVIDYANAGGRVFATHFSYVWVEGAQAPFPGTGVWNIGEPNPPSPTTYLLDTTFPKGNSFADWLVSVGASTTRGQLSIIESRHNLDAVNPGLAQRWFYGTSPATVQHYTFNTPVAALLPDGGAPDQCGRVLFSDFHVSAAALSGQTTFPASCKSDGLSGQEKALAFMLFDLSGCVQRDEIAPPIY
ncbi:MAG: hypothetical protein ACYC8T_15250 [Myxococcaceae bacterium]